jgi:RHS repeat-associated protein
MVTTEAIPGAEVEVKAGTLENQEGELYTEELSITEVPRELTPAALPENLLPDIVVTIQPGEMVFTAPAPLALPNTGGFDPGTEMDLWSINPVTGQFDKVGVGRVSEDRTVIETVEGGINNSSWHFFAPPPEEPTDPDDNPRNPDDGCEDCKGTAPGTSEVELHSGSVIETHNLVAYQSLGVTRSWTLNYDSLRADPRSIVNFGYANVQADPNRRLVAELSVMRGDFEYQVPGFAGGFGLDGGEHFWSIPSGGGPVDAALQVDMRALPSGRYDYEITTGLLRLNEGQFTGSTAVSGGQLIHVNTINSIFGSGWGLAGLQELVENPDGSVLLIDGDGTQLIFEVNPEGGYISPAGDFSTLELLDNNTFRRTMTDQTVYNFNAANKLVSMTDRNGNQTQFVYEDGRISKIIDPVGLETTFTYANGKVTEITDPADRITKLQYDTAGNLIRIIDPDASQRTWEYDDEHHMTAETDKRGNREQTFYDFAGRADKAIKKDGAELDFDPVQVQGLYEPDETLDPLGAPVAFQLGAVESKYVDANGNTITYTLDQAGQIVSASDEVGNLPNVDRNEDNLIVRRTDARGNVSLYTYDDNGNLLTVEDGIAGGNADGITVNGSIAEPGETDQYTFSGVAGQRLYFDGFTGDFGIDVQLLSPSGASVLNFVDSNDDRGPFTLLETGTYTLSVNRNSGTTENYSFQLIDTASTSSLTLETPINDNLDPGIETDIYQFTGTAGQRILVDSLVDGAIFGANWALYSPSNQALSNVTLGVDFQNTLPVDGTYLLVIDGNTTGGTLNYGFRVADTSDDPVDVSGLENAFSGEIAAEEEDSFTFTAPAGLPIYLDSADSDNESVNIELLDPTDTQVFLQNANFDRGPIILSRGGTYTVKVSGVGDYNFRLVNLQNVPNDLILGESTSETLAVSESDFYSFTGTPGQNLYFDSLVADSSNIVFNLFGPNNNSLFFINSNQNQGPLTLTEAGTYYLVPNNNGEAAADYNFRLLDLADATALELDTTITDSLDPGLESNLYQFEGTTNQRLFFDQLLEPSTGNWSLYGPNNQFIRSSFLGSDFDATLPVDGTYILFLEGNSADSSIDYSFQVVTSETTTDELTLGEEITGEISEFGEIDEFTFEGVGKRVYFDALSTGNNINAQLLSPNGNSIFFNSAIGDRGPFTLIEEGTYRLILSANFGQTGNYNFRLLDATAADTLELDTTITDTLDPGNSSKIYQFEGTTDQRIFFDQLLNPNSGNWIVYGPANQFVRSSFIGNDLDVTLPTNGTYLLVVEGNTADGTTDYSFKAIAPETTIAELTLGETITGEIAEPGEVDEFTFNGIGKRLYFDSRGADNNLNAQLISPNGNNIFSTNASFDRAPFTLTEAGKYKLILTGNSSATGDYKFRLLDTAETNNLELDTTITDSINPGLSSVIYQIEGTADQRLFFNQLSNPSSGNWTLYGTGNQFITSTFIGNDFDATLPTDGTYLLVLEGNVTSGTIDYSFEVVEAATTTTALTLGETVTENIAVPGEIDEFTFSGIGKRFYFDALGTDPNIDVQLISPNNNNIFFINSNSDREPFTLTEAGNYRLVFNGNFGATGDYKFRLLPVADAPEIELNTNIDNNLNPGLETDIYKIVGVAGQKLKFDQLLSPSTGNWQLYGPGNQFLTNNFLGTDFETTLTLDGTYILALQGNASSGTINYRFKVTDTSDDPVDVSGLGEVFAGDIEAGQVDTFTFDAPAGLSLYLDSQDGDGEAITITVLDPDATQILATNASSDSGPIILTRSGTYTVNVAGNAADTTGDYKFFLRNLSGANELTLGEIIDESAAAFATDIYSFAGTPGQKLYFDSLVPNSNTVNVQLLSPSGVSIININSSSDREPFTLTEPGTYHLFLQNSGDAAIDYSFRLSDLADATALELDTTTTGTLDPGIATDLYQFDGTANQKLFFDNLSDYADPWFLYGPANQFIAGNGSGSDFETTLAVDGKYTLVFDGDTTEGSVDYNFQVITPEITTTELTLGDAIAESIDEFGEVDRYTFTGTIGQKLYYDALGIDFRVDGQLFSPTGASIFFVDSSSDREPITLTEAGEYTLAINGEFAQTGDYSFRLLDLADATTLELDTEISDTIDPGLASILYKFEGTANQTLFFDNLGAFNNGWFLYGPANQFIAGNSFGGDFATTLSIDGTYTLVLDGNTSDGTIDYNFQVVTPETTITELTLGDSIAESISEPGEIDEYTFSATAGQKLYYDALGTDFRIDAQLFSPSGTSVFFINSNDDRDPLTLTETGNYRLVINGESDGRTGDYSFRLLDLADATTLELDTEVADTLNPGLSSTLYKFEGTANQKLFFDNLDAFNDGWFLYGPNNQFIAGNGSGSDFDATLPTDGTYVLILDGTTEDGTIDYDFTVVTPETTTTALNLGSTGIGKREFTYDPEFNQITSITDELGRQILLDLDPNTGNLLSLTQVVGEVGGNDDIITQFTYTDKGLIDTIIDPLGRLTDNDYDENNRIVSTTFAKGTADEAIQKFEYDDAGNQTAFIDENGNRTVFEYDAFNRLVKFIEADPDGDGPLNSPVTTFTYDVAGNLLTTTDALGNVTKNQYDILNRLTGTIDALNQKTSFSYDRLGNLISIIDPLEHETKNSYDERDRLIETIDPDEGSTKFGYDLDDNLTSVIDSLGNETTFVYDARNRLLSETDPFDKTIVYEYDAVNNLIVETDRNNRRTEFSYDEIDRLITETWIGTDQVLNYSYDKASNLTSVTDQFSSLAFTYDNRDRVLTVDNAGTPGAPNVVLAYTYDKAGNILSVVDTIEGDAGGTNTYSYDALNRLIKLTQTGNNVSDKRVDFGYNPLGQFASLDRYSDLDATNLVTGTTYTYDELNRLISLTHNNGTEDVAFYNYVYDAANRITKITDVDGVADYTYDDRNQLIEADRSNENNPDESYSYDANGNRIESSIHGDGYQTGDGNRLLSDGTYNYEYDNEGNLIRRTEIATDNVREFEWDYRNRLIAVIDKDAEGNETQRVEFTYDAFDRRIAKEVDSTPQDNNDGVVTYFIYNGENVHLDFVDSDGRSGENAPALEQRYLHGVGVDQILAQEDSSGNVIWMLSDQLGTIRDLVNNNGTLANHLVYDSFGQVISESNSNVDTRYLFTGREFDEELGLQYNRARYYNPLTGRFLNEDLISFNSGTTNLYKYANNSPTNFIDPDGLQAGSLTIRLLPVAGGAALSDGPLPIGDAVAIGILVVAGIADLILLSQAREKGENEITRQVKADAQTSGRDPCDILDEMLRACSDGATKRKIQQAQKFLGCRNKTKRQEK